MIKPRECNIHSFDDSGHCQVCGMFLDKKMQEQARALAEEMKPVIDERTNKLNKLALSLGESKEDKPITIPIRLEAKALNLIEDLRIANDKGLAPPQDWTHRTIEVIDGLLKQNLKLEAEKKELEQGVWDGITGSWDELGSTPPENW